MKQSENRQGISDTSFLTKASGLDRIFFFSSITIQFPAKQISEGYKHFKKLFKIS